LAGVSAAESLRGSVAIDVSDDELVKPLDIAWDADAGLDTIPSAEHGIRTKPRREEPHGHD
jgi:hypothetical protein